MTYKLLGAEVSYYSGKVRSYLRRKGIPFEEIQATREIYRNEIMPRVGWPVVPVVITPKDETLQDTTDIIDALEERFPRQPVYPATPRQRLAALLLEVYGDEWLVLPAMHYRWNHCYDWIVGEFGRMSRPDLSEEEQRIVGAKNARQFHAMLPALGVSDETRAAIEASYEALLGDLDRHFERLPFLFGERASIGDYGLIGPLYAHLYRDPYPGELMRRTAPCVAEWVERMMAEHRAQDETGEFLPDDEVPETLLPVLGRMVSEQFPVLLSTLRQTERWLAVQRDKEAIETDELSVPRGLEPHEFTLERGTPHEVTAKRMVMPFNQWMFQRPLFYYQGLDGESRDACRSALLDRIGAGDALDTEVSCVLERKDFKLTTRSGAREPT